MCDLSILLNIHAEDYLLRPTLLSLDQCAFLAKTSGISVELVCVQNSVSKLTKKIFENFRFTGIDKVQVVETSNLSLGLARNQGIERCSGEFIWTADGDDLVSENAITSFFEIIKSEGVDANNTVLFPEFLLEFGRSYHIFKYLSEPLISYVDFAFTNPYVSRIFIKRKVLLENLYNDLQKVRGFAFEDWDLNNRLKQKGMNFKIAPNVILFYRKRQDSLLQRIVRNSSNVVNNSKYYDPSEFYAAYKKDKILIEKIYRLRREKNSTLITAQEFVKENYLSLKKAAQLEPDIDLREILKSQVDLALSHENMKKGVALARLYAICGAEQYTDVVVLPFLRAGGGEKYITSVLQEIKRLDPNSKFLVITGQACDFHEYKSLLPADSTFIDLYNIFADFTPSDLLELAFRLIINVSGSKSRLHLKASPFANSIIERFGGVLSEYFVSYYYRFSDSTYVYNSEFHTDPWGIDFIRNNLKKLDFVVCDSDALIRKDLGRLGDCSKYRLLKNLCNLQSKDSEVNLHEPLVFLWASRIAYEKRIVLLPLIAKGMEEKGLNCRIEVWGNGEVDQIKQLKRSIKNLACIRYMGGFEDFQQLPIHKYSALIYTSYFDGTPNVILEAMSQGLPVIAPDVGGIPSIMNNGGGYLLTNEHDDIEMSRGYLDTISQINSNKTMLAKLSEISKQVIRENYGERVFSKNVKEIFFSPVGEQNENEKEYR